MLYFILHRIKVDENMARAHKIEAASTQKFFFRKYMAPPDAMESCSSTVCKRFLGIHQTYISHVPTACNTHKKRKTARKQSLAASPLLLWRYAQTFQWCFILILFLLYMHACMYVCMYFGFKRLDVIP